MIRRKHIAFIAISILVILGILEIVVPNRKSFERYVCIDCGIRSEVDRRTIGGLYYLNNVLLYPTEVSGSIEVFECDHEWLRYRFVSTFGRGFTGGWLEHAQGRSNAGVIGVLLLDSKLAEEIADFPEPATTWRELILGIEEDAELQAAFSRWWERGLERKPFNSWWSEYMAPNASNDQAQQIGAGNSG